MDDRERPIGVFDSGVGGLSVLRALRERLPDERFLYLGDTARVPYGTKSAATVRTYAMRAGAFFEERGVKALVVACNSASAVAIDALRDRWGDQRSVVGVIEPGAQAAASTGDDIIVLATEATVASGAYERAIHAHAPNAVVRSVAATLLVALAEEGWTSGPVVESVVQEVLHDELVEPRPECVLLGCTHFPVLAGVIRKTFGDEVAIVDSAQTTALALAQTLKERGLGAPTSESGGEELCVTDGVERFARVSSRFLGRDVDPEAVTLIDLA